MSKNVYIIILFFFSLMLCSCAPRKGQEQPPSLVSIQIIDRNGFSETISAKDRLSRYQKVDFHQPQPYQKVLRVFTKDEQGKSSSFITSYHPNGHIWQSLSVIDGRAHGTYRQWYPNGHIKMELQVIEGMADLSEKAFSSWVFEGENRIWDEDGFLEAKIMYEKGALHGISTYYYKDGSVKKQIPYIEDAIHGEVVFYSERGSLIESTSFSEGKLEGTSLCYTPSADMLYLELWKEDKLLEGSYYTQDHTLISTVVDGCGKKVEFAEGKIQNFIEYKEGTAEGEVQCLDSDGNITSSYFQKDGKKHGSETIYYTGKKQPKLLLSWQEDVLQGIVKTWFLDGTQESQKEMYQNKKNGPALAWYKNGDLMLMEEYENDVLVSGSYFKKGDTKPVSRIHNKKGTATLYDPEGYFLKKIPYEKGIPILEEEH